MTSAEKGEGAIDVETCRVGVRDIQIAGGHCDVLCCIVCCVVSCSTPTLCGVMGLDVL
jgi:hypothetical protein